VFQRLSSDSQDALIGMFQRHQLSDEEAAQGMGHLSPALVSRVMREFGRLSEAVSVNKALFAELSHREVEVLEKIGQGLRNKVIAEQLSLSEKTVKTHVGSILRKLHLNDRTEAALLAQKHGLSS
jgi:DNA-binding NarL/FixJ family response regulator